jgi:hypothetical protein
MSTLPDTQIAPVQRPSMPEVFSSVRVSQSPYFWRRALGFVGPGFLISVGYMDPGNWATDLAGGSRYGYTLLFVIMLSNLMAILLQSLSIKLGVAIETCICIAFLSLLQLLDQLKELLVQGDKAPHNPQRVPHLLGLPGAEDDGDRRL